MLTRKRLLLLNQTDPNLLFEDLFNGAAVNTNLWTITDTYASEEQITNGTFPANITGWTNASVGTGSIAWNAGGYMDIINDGGANTGVGRQSITTIANKTYTLTFDVGVGSLTLNIGTSAGGQQIQSSTAYGAGSQSVSFTATTTTTWFDFANVTASTTHTLDNVSVKATTGLISVSGGNLDFAGGRTSPGWTDPALVSVKSWARQAGLTIEWQVTPGATNKYINIGFTDGSLAGSGIESDAVNITGPGGLIYVVCNTNGVQVPFYYSAATSYWFRIVLKATGADYYVSTDSRVTWKLIWVNSSVTTTPVYASVESYNAALTASKVEVRQGSVRPAVLSASPGAPALTLGGELATGNLSVGSWYEITATEVNYFFTGCAIGNIFRATAATALDANNKVKNIPFDQTGVLEYIDDAGVKPGIAKANITVAAGYHAGFAVCADSATAPTYNLLAYVDRTAAKAYLLKNVNGTWTELVAAAITYSAGAELRLIGVGSSWGLYYNSLLCGGIQTVDVSSNYGTHCHSFQTGASDTVASFTFDTGVGA